MQAAAGHDVCLPTKNFGGPFLDVHQLKQSELAALMVEEQVNVGIVSRLVTRCRTEQIQVLNAQLLQLGFMRLKDGYGLVALQVAIVA